MKWFRRGERAPGSLAEVDRPPIDPEELAAARDIVRRALDADSVDDESAGRDLFRLDTA
jgi:hypothetical protein